MKPASRKKAVSASMQIIGPRIGPTAREYLPQLRPSSKVSTIPYTIPSPKPTAKILRQNRNI